MNKITNNNEAFMSIVEKMITSNEEIAKSAIEANQAAMDWMYDILKDVDEATYEPTQHSIVEDEEKEKALPSIEDIITKACVHNLALATMGKKMVIKEKDTEEEMEKEKTPLDEMLSKWKSLDEAQKTAEVQKVSEYYKSKRLNLPVNPLSPFATNLVSPFAAFESKESSYE